MLGLSTLDKLADRLTRIVANGRQAIIAASNAVRPLDAPVNPAAIGQQSEYRDGSIIQRQSFRVSVFEDTELKEINKFRKGSQAVIEKLGLPLEKGLDWVPNSVIAIVESEIKAIDEMAREMLMRLIGNSVADYIKTKTDKIEKDLSAVYRRLGGEGKVPPAAMTQLINDLTRRMERAIGGHFVTPVAYSATHFFLSSDEGNQGLEEGIHAPWAQAARLSLALARFPRTVAIKPKTLAGLQTPEAEIVAAMNVANDVFAKIPWDREFERRARSELQLLDRIDGAAMTDRARCEASFMIIDGVLPRDIHQFIAETESMR